MGLDVDVTRLIGGAAVPIKFSDGWIIDAFGRVRVSLPNKILELKHLHDARTLQTSSVQISGSGTSATYRTNEACVRLAVGNTTAGVHVLLQYDDGDPLYAVYSDRWDFNEGLACYFTPPVTPAVLKGFCYYFVSLDAYPGYGGSDGSFYAFGADYYGPILADTFRYVRPGGTGWNLVDLSADNITLYGDFFAGMFWDAWNSPMVGWDTNATNGLNLVFTDIGGIQDWYLWDGTFFIRAVVSYMNQVTGVSEEVLLPPARFSLSQNYPNPFNPATQIEYDVPSAGIFYLKRKGHTRRNPTFATVCLG